MRSLVAYSFLSSPKGTRTSLDEADDTAYSALSNVVGRPTLNVSSYGKVWSMRKDLISDP
jgi:hypothetical protein